MDLQRLNWKIFGLTLVFAILTGVAYFVSQESRAAQDETRGALISALEEAVDTVCLATEHQAEDLAKDSTVRQLFLEQIDPHEFSIATNSGNGRVRLWNAEGKEWNEGEFIASVCPVTNDRILFFTPDDLGNPRLAAGIAEPVLDDTTPIGLVGVFGLLDESDFGFANWGLTLETPDGKTILTVPPQVNIPTETMEYALTDGRGSTATLARIEIPHGHPALTLTVLFRALTFIALGLFVLGVLAQFLMALLGKKDA